MCIVYAKHIANHFNFFLSVYYKMPTKRPRGRPRKYAGPKMKDGRFYSKKGLNKTEKTETKQIVKREIAKNQHVKYFNSLSVEAGEDPQAPAVSAVATALKQVSVIGYSSTTNKNAAGVTQQYGSQNIRELFLARPFKEGATDPELSPNALNGQYCLPKTARTDFCIERVGFNVDTQATNDPVTEAAEALPISFRVVRIGFKAQAGNQVVVDPNVDLFIDQFGNEIGIDSDDFNRMVCKYAPINSKKYKKLMDKQFTIYQNNIMVPHFNNSGGDGRTTQFFSNAASAQKYLNINFRLSQRKNGKLFYEEPQAATDVNTFTSGGERELLLIHSWFDNGHNLLGGTRPNAPTSTDLTIRVRTQSTFVDAQ